MIPRVLITDDHPLTRDALAGLLNGERIRRRRAGRRRPGGDRARRRARAGSDRPRPDHAGHGRAEALPRLREAAPAASVVVLTASEDDDNLLSAIRLGAAGYLLKNEPPERIVQFLHGVANGEAALSGAVARRLLDQVREGGHRHGVVPQSIADLLSARELEVLLLLDQHLGTDEIAERLFISEHTVRSHVKNLLAKLGVSSRREALEKLAAARGD